MKKTVEKFPVISTVILFLVGVVLAAIFIALDPGSGNASSIGRIVVGILFLLLFIRCFRLQNAFRGFVLLLPAWLLGLYMIPLHFITDGAAINPLTVTLLLGGLAPAVFEEILFRGILIHGLEKKYRKPMAVVLISAALFSLVHLTNMMGLPLSSLIVQVIFSFVVGIIFGAVYLRTGDIVSCILVHALIDIISAAFPSGTETPFWVIAVFVLLLLAEAVYGIVLTKKTAPSL